MKSERHTQTAKIGTTCVTGAVLAITGSSGVRRVARSSHDYDGVKRLLGNVASVTEPCVYIRAVPAQLLQLERHLRSATTQLTFSTAYISALLSDGRHIRPYCMCC